MNKISSAVRSRLKRTHLSNAVLLSAARKPYSPVMIDDCRETLQGASPRPRSSFGAFRFVNPASLDVSVIVPAYNVEKYIGPCLDSILSQKVDFDMEVIVVNDGSTDGTLAEVKSRASFDSRVVLIDQANRGFSGARNAAIDLARGGAFCFVDSDDMLAPGHLQALWNAISATHADFVSATWSKMTEEGKVLGCAERVRTHGAPWSRMYSRRVWENIRFPENFWFEDTVQAYCINSRFSESFCDDDGYLRRYRGDSITAVAFTNQKSIDSFWVVEEMLDWCDALGIPMTDVYEQTIRQFGPILLSRTKWMDDGLRRCLFSCCSQLLIARFERPASYLISGQGRYLEQALWERNYDLWLTACRWS